MIYKSDLINTISKAAILGTAIVFGTNIICLAIAYNLIDIEVENARIGVITVLLAIVGIADLVVAFILKRKFLSPLFDQSTQPDRNMLWKHSLKVTIVTASVCSSLPIYGLASVFIDSNMNAMVAFAIASLAAFMILRLRPRDFIKIKIDQYPQI